MAQDEEGAAGDAPGVMKRGGFYNRHSLPQHDAAGMAMSLLDSAVDAVPLPPPGVPFVIADYGAAQGGNSLAPMRAAISALRRRGAETMPISVVHTDIPEDDFSALFTLLEGSPESYLKGDANVFPFAAGRSFYNQIFPAGSVSLGWSAISVQWLSAAPATIDGHIWSPRAPAATLAAFARQSAEDWSNFLSYRAIEMRPGARLVVIGGGSDEHGDSAANGLMDMANSVLRELVANRILAADEYRRMVIPTYNRRPAEFAAPFAGGRATGGLGLQHQELQILDDPIWAEYRETGDLDAFVNATVDFFDAAFSPSIFSALAPGRLPEQRQSLTESFKALLKARIADDPASASCRWRVFAMLIVKDR